MIFQKKCLDLPYPFLFIFSVLVVIGCKEEPVDLRITQMDPSEAAAQAKHIEGLINPELADGLNLSLWAPDSLVTDPISIDIDENGHLYYSRTNRRRVSEFDIRNHPDWEIESLKLQSVEDRRAFIRRVLALEDGDKNQWFPDINGDGSHDWRDLTVEKEHVYRLEDTDGDGVADLSQLVVEDFHEEVTDVAGGVMINEGDLYVGVAPDLWRMKDTNGDGIVDEKTSISHGYGVHIGFGGHNMSGITMGPDGRLYWSIGDIAFNGTGPDGTEWKYPNQGVIVRSNPDGSDFEVFASGLRNVHEFAFDEFANLIGVDNDGDHGGERERLVYLVNGSDTGWRTNWQFGKYRDPLNNGYKVWMDEGLHLPRFEGQPAYITPTIANFVNGPTGLVYNPGTALSPRWRNTFFVAEFVGNPARSGVHHFRLEPEGASFGLASHGKLLGGILATGLDFGPDGALYIADWIDGWVNKGYGRIWKLDDDEGGDWSERSRTRELLSEDLDAADLSHLDGLLKYPDLRIRQRAQFALARRGSAGAEVLQANVTQRDDQLARIHGIIGLSQLARLEDGSHAEALLPLLGDEDPEIRAQAAKWLGDIRYADAGPALLGLLTDGYPRAAFFAAEALGRIGYREAVPGLVGLLEANADEDAYIRHAASLALARIGDGEALVALSDHPSAAVRLGAVLALRRMSDAGVAVFLADDDEFIVTAAARAINDDFSIEGALPALGDLLLSTEFTNEALIRRAVSANLRVGGEKALSNLITYSAREGVPVPMRVEALDALGTWASPSVLDRVDGRYRGEVERGPSLARKTASSSLIELLNNREVEIRLAAVTTMGGLGVTEGITSLFDVLKDDSDPTVRSEALKSLSVIDTKNMGSAIKQALSDNNKDVRISGLDLLEKLDIEPQIVTELLTEVIEKRTTEEKQASVLALGSVPSSHSLPILEDLLRKLEEGRLPSEIHLELSEAIEESGSETLLEKYNAYTAGLSMDSLTASYSGSLYGGDVELGRRVFFRNQSAQCVRCHAYDDMGGGAGPPLDGIAGKLSREQLLESLIAPSKRLAPGYGTVLLELDNGNLVGAVLGKETEEELVLKIGNDPDTLVHKRNIKKRTDAPSSMPDMKEILTRREIRDLVSFLATLKEKLNE